MMCENNVYVQKELLGPEVKVALIDPDFHHGRI